MVVEATLKLVRVGNGKWMSHFNAFYITKTKPKVAFPNHSAEMRKLKHKNSCHNPKVTQLVNAGSRNTI